MGKNPDYDPMLEKLGSDYAKEYNKFISKENFDPRRWVPSARIKADLTSYDSVVDKNKPEESMLYFDFDVHSESRRNYTYDSQLQIKRVGDIFYPFKIRHVCKDVLNNKKICKHGHAMIRDANEKLPNDQAFYLNPNHELVGRCKEIEKPRTRNSVEKLIDTWKAMEDYLGGTEMKLLSKMNSRIDYTQLS